MTRRLLSLSFLALTLPLLQGGGLAAAAQAGLSRPAALQPLPLPATLPGDGPSGQLELVHSFTGQLPVGVAFSPSGRVFISYPRWDLPAKFTLGELVGGREVAFPNADFAGYTKGQDPKTHLVSAQGVAVDAKNRLWVLDTGSLNFSDIIAPGAAKLVCIDLGTNKVVKTITFPPDVVPAVSYLNDLRIDLKRGQDGAAYITDSGERSDNGVIVVDLASGQSWRKLAGHPSVNPEPGYVGFVQGRALLTRKPGKGPSFPATGADGVAISSDGKTLYYSPNSGRHLYAVPTDVLWDRSSSEVVVSGAVKDLGQKPGAADGLGEDAAGNVYVTDYEQNAVLRREANGDYTTLLRDPRLLWPDTIALNGGYLYVTANQLENLSGYNNGVNRQRPPFSLFRVKVGASPLYLK